MLVLEDDPTLRELIFEELEDRGYRVSAVGSSEEALQVARRVPFDLIVADVRMAGMDGIECLRALREVQPKARRLVITGYASQDAPGRAIDVEAEDYLYKPFKMGALVQSIERILGCGEEKRRLQGILATALRRLVEKAGAAIATAELASLEPQRERAMSGFYVAVRSKMLSRHDAQAVWEKLEELEGDREALKTPGRHAREHRALGEGYRYVNDLLRATTRGGAHVLQPRGRLPGAVFNYFLEGIQAGRTSPEQVKVAAFLRLVPAEERRASAELESLHRELWGPAA